MGDIILLLVVGTSIWVGVDAKTIGVKKGQIEGMGNMGPLGWFFVCLLFWIVGFPFYLAKRGEFKKLAKSRRPDSDRSSEVHSDSFSQLEKLAELKERGILTADEFDRKKQEILV